MTLDGDTALRPTGGGAYEGEIHADWWTPRGPLGGYVMAIMLRAMTAAVADVGRQPRSLTVYFLRPPEAGAVTVRPAVERAGRSLTTASARLEQAGEVLALGLGAFSVPWEGPLLSEAPIPDVEPAEAKGATPPPPGAEEGPPFLQLVSMQPRFGPAPFSGADTAETGGWLGLREEREVDALTLVILADAWFPTPWTRLSSFAPAPTVELTVYFRSPLPLPDELLLGRFRTRLVRDGFFEEDGELWAPDGTLVAQSRQLGLLIGAEG